MVSSLITVTVAPETTDLTTKARFKAAMNISGSTDDAYIDTLIKQASVFIETYCNSQFAKRTVSELIRTEETKYLKLSCLPVRSVISITYQGDVVAAADYLLDLGSLGAVLNIEDCWNCTGYKYDYVAVYVFGYVLPSFSTGTVDPEGYDLENACQLMVNDAYSSRGSSSGIKRIDMPDVYAESYAGGEFVDTGINPQFSPRVAQILAPYKRRFL